MIKLERVYKSYTHGRSYVVNDVSMTISEGEFLILLGSSGSGKTTLLKMINRLIQPSSGIIEVDGRNILDVDKIKLRRSIGYVFQGVGLFPHMTIEENIAIVLRLEKKSREYQRTRAHELLSFVNLEPNTFAQRYPDELSGGQQQRVGVARALANDPAYLLMDEPFGALDPITRDELQAEMLALMKNLKKTLIFVTHDIFEALRLGDRIAILHHGVLQQLGNKDDLLNNPANQLVKDMFTTAAQQFALLDGENGQ